MKVAIMQPYFFPYIGYFQLIKSADFFVVYDNIKYTKKGWINRNRFLQNGKDAVFSVPLKNDSDFLDVKERTIAADFNKAKFLNQFKEAYRRAPFFEAGFSLLERVVMKDELNLFHYIHNAIIETCRYLEIDTKIVVSSTLSIDHSLQNQEKVLALCQHVGADTYINAIGGLELYSKDVFLQKNIQLHFQKSKPFEYKQFNQPFIPWLSIVDVIMFNSKENIQQYMTNFELV